MQWLRSAIAVFVFWMVLAIPAQPSDLVWGAVVALLLGLWSVRVLWPEGGPAMRLRRWPRILGHLVDLFRAMVPAALQLSAILARRHLRIDPHVFSYRTRLQTAAARVALANSITLTPGTHCVEIEGGELIIHCLDESFARRIRSGELEAEVGRVFEPGWRP